MTDHNKWAFWGFLLILFAAASIPSSVLLEAIARYKQAASAFEPGMLKPVRMRFLPRRGAGAKQKETELDFVAFRLKDAKAKEVQLVGDFNGWRPGTLKLSRKSGALWELLVPLPAGRYRYRFVVDGEPRLDPSVKLSEDAEGEAASVRSVP